MISVIVCVYLPFAFKIMISHTCIHAHIYGFRYIKIKQLFMAVLISLLPCCPWQKSHQTWCAVTLLLGREPHGPYSQSGSHTGATESTESACSDSILSPGDGRKRVNRQGMQWSYFLARESDGRGLEEGHCYACRTCCVIVATELSGIQIS